MPSITTNVTVDVRDGRTIISTFDRHAEVLTRPSYCVAFLPSWSVIIPIFNWKFSMSITCLCNVLISFYCGKCATKCHVSACLPCLSCSAISRQYESCWPILFKWCVVTLCRGRFTVGLLDMTIPDDKQLLTVFFMCITFCEARVQLKCFTIEYMPHCCL